jgi:hypothetical protein
VHLYTESHGDAVPSPDALATAAPGAPGVELFYDEQIRTIQAPQASPAAGNVARTLDPTAAVSAGAVAGNGSGAQAASATAAAATATAASASAAPKLSMLSYLEKHDVAGVLNVLVNKVGAEQPADPFAYLAEELAKRQGSGACFQT